MKRELKFRAYWHNPVKDTWSMEYPLDVDTLDKIVIDLDGNPQLSVCDLNKDRGSLRNYLPGEIELMQYTGLKDKHGKEIYEGDVVKNGHLTYLVKWEDRPLDDSSSYVGFSVCDCCEREVIGNIYEHGHLLDSK